MNSFRFLLISILIGAGIYLLTIYGVNAAWFKRPTLLEVIVGLNVVVTFIAYRWLLKIQGTQFFVNGYLLSIVIKLVFFCGLLLAVRILIPNSLTPNAILVMISYFIFTILEVTILFLKIGR